MRFSSVIQIGLFLTKHFGGDLQHEYFNCCYLTHFFSNYIFAPYLYFGQPGIWLFNVWCAQRERSKVRKESQFNCLAKKEFKFFSKKQIAKKVKKYLFLSC